VAYRRVGRHRNEFRRIAVKRLNACDNMVRLSQGLGVHRRLVYKWRDHFDQCEPVKKSPPVYCRAWARLLISLRTSCTFLAWSSCLAVGKRAPDYKGNVRRVKSGTTDPPSPSFVTRIVHRKEITSL
jgi:hypothetical protein